MSRRAVYSIFIETAVREKARSRGLNISRVCENCLRVLLQRLDDFASVTTETLTSSKLNDVKEAKIT